MLFADIAGFGKRTNKYHRRAVRMNVIVRRLSVVKSNKNSGPGIGFFVIIHRAFYEVLDDHAECDVAILNLLSRFRVNRLTGLWINSEVCRGFARVIIWQINIEKAGKGPLICHAIEIVDELQSSSLI